MYFKTIVLSLFTQFMLMNLATAQFKSQQLKHSRVSSANSEKSKNVEQLLVSNGIKKSQLTIYLIAYKSEGRLELWGKNKEGSSYKFIKYYPICASSGELGPKRKQGDLQVPEGIYHINRFNPYSNFHLSLGLNYPNKSDKILKNGHNPGGDIFIHGNCVTIGCLPITDDMIKELYLICVEAKNNGQEIPVAIYPAKLDNMNFTRLIRENEGNSDRLVLWNSLKQCYDYFNKHHSIPPYHINSEGKYIVKQ